MIRLNLHRLLMLHGIRHERSYMINHGYTEDEVRGLLRNVPRVIRLDMMMRLCKTFNCLPNDLLTWEGDGRSHLNVLKKPDATMLHELFEGKSPEEIEGIMRRLGDG